MSSAKALRPRVPRRWPRAWSAGGRRGQFTCLTDRASADAVQSFMGHGCARLVRTTADTQGWEAASPRGGQSHRPPSRPGSKERLGAHCSSRVNRVGVWRFVSMARHRSMVTVVACTVDFSFVSLTPRADEDRCAVLAQTIGGAHPVNYHARAANGHGCATHAAPWIESI